MEHPNPRSVLDCLVKRRELLGLLRDGPRRKGELVEEAGVSRSTIDRAIRELELVGLVDRTPDGFALTLCGRLAFSEFDSFTDRLGELCRSHALISTLPPETAIDAAVLDGADVTYSEPQVPMKPLARFERLVESASSIRGFSPAILPNYVDLFHRQVVDEELLLELVLDPGVVERLATTYAAQLGEVIETGRATIYEAADPVPFGLALTEAGEVAVVVYGDSGIAGVIVNDSADAYEWATDRYEELRSAATSIHRADEVPERIDSIR